MYPDVPYEGISWPITQHAGVLKAEVFDGLLNACLQCRDQVVDTDLINGYLVENNILTANVRADSNQVDAWRDYQQILSEFGLIYSTRLSKVLRLTPIAMAYLNGNISYAELITLQLLRYQYPNGHKSQLSPSLVQSYNGDFKFESFTEFQSAQSILLRPAVLVWFVLKRLWEKGQQAYITLDEMQTYVVRCTTVVDYIACADNIIASRSGDIHLESMSRARRNMSDWLKLLNQTMLFRLSADGNAIALSAYSIRERKAVENVCNKLADPKYYWSFEKENFKQDWFDYYGDYDSNIEFVLKE